MPEDDDEAPPIDPKKVALFVILLAMIAAAGWRYWQARQAVAAVAEASKDYRKLFPTRADEAPPPEIKTALPPAASVSGIGLLKVDDDMRTPKPAPAPAPAPPPAAPTPPPAVVETAPPAAPVKRAPKPFNQPRLNSGAFSGLNGGAGVGISGSGLSGGGGGSAPAAPALPPAAADQK